MNKIFLWSFVLIACLALASLANSVDAAKKTNSVVSKGMTDNIG